MFHVKHRRSRQRRAPSDPRGPRRLVRDDGVARETQTIDQSVGEGRVATSPRLPAREGRVGRPHRAPYGSRTPGAPGAPHGAALILTAPVTALHPSVPAQLTPSPSPSPQLTARRSAPLPRRLLRGCSVPPLAIRCRPLVTPHRSSWLTGHACPDALDRAPSLGCGVPPAIRPARNDPRSPRRSPLPWGPTDPCRVWREHPQGLRMRGRASGAARARQEAMAWASGPQRVTQRHGPREQSASRGGDFAPGRRPSRRRCAA
jgi:hypothetical protein